jgi:hypothetical protein
MDPFPWLALLGVVIWIVDRILLWCELRGWISYRRMPRVRHSYGDAVLGIDALLQPQRRHIIELKQAVGVHREDDDEAGGDDEHRITVDVDPDRAGRDADREADGSRKKRQDVSPPLRHD